MKECSPVQVKFAFASVPQNQGKGLGVHRGVQGAEHGAGASSWASLGY